MNSDETKNINAVFILEAIGRPPEHLTKALTELTKKMGEEKGVKVKDKKINNPVLMKDQKDFYTTFAEIEIQVDEALQLLLLIFKYMPAHVEIISPEYITLTNDGLCLVLNELTRRLHGYDEIARVIQVEKNILEKKLRTVLEEKKEPEKEEKK